MSDQENRIEVKHVKPTRKTTRYVLMCRFGDDHWGATSTHDTALEAQGAAKGGMIGIHSWRVIEVTGLPIEVAGGEV